MLHFYRITVPKQSGPTYATTNRIDQSTFESFVGGKTADYKISVPDVTTGTPIEHAVAALGTEQAKRLPAGAVAVWRIDDKTGLAEMFAGNVPAA